MADSDIIELFVVPSRGLLDALVRGKTDTNPVSGFALTQSDNATLRVRFFSEDPATATLTPIDYGVISLGFAGRPAGGLEDDALFQADAFTRVVDGDDVYYDSPISFNTIPTNLELANRTQIEATCDLQTSGPSKKARFDLTLYREIYRGGAAPAPGTDTWPTAASANAAIDAANDAATDALDAAAIALAAVGPTGPTGATGDTGPTGAILGTAGVRTVSADGAFSITDSDNGKVIVVTASGATTATLTDPIADGFACVVIRDSATGGVTFANSSSQTMKQPDSFTVLRADGSQSSVIRAGSKIFLCGDFSA